MSSARTSSSPYLFQSRHGIWYARVVVPEDRRDAIGKRELRKTLATKDKREAVLRSWDVLKALHALAKGKASATQSPSASLESSQGRAVVSAPVPPEIPPVSPQLPKLSQIADEYSREKVLGGAWSKHTESVNRKTFRDMITLLGDLRIDQFTKELAQRYKQHYSAKTDLSVATINKYLTRVTALLQWASAHYGTPNPMAGMSIRVSAKVKVSKEREALTPFQIKQLFQALPIGNAKRYAYRYWVPRLAAYTGARVGELAQLYLDDFTVIDGHPCILIRASHPDQSIKTPSSERAIPIHPKLIALGFLHFVERQRSLGHQRLFPELPKQEARGYSHAVSKWFHNFKRKLDWGERETLHGIRHAVATQLKRKEFSSDLVAGLLGHSHGSITFDRYGKEYKVNNLLRVVEALDWE
ncbi:site-specific integrase [Shewanella algae]|uniref:site-specific integrase n=1 Tax=Shewanella TaxID=22 RepID=UPI0031F4A4FD